MLHTFPQRKHDNVAELSEFMSSVGHFSWPHFPFRLGPWALNDGSLPCSLKRDCSSVLAVWHKHLWISHQIQVHLIHCKIIPHPGVNYTSSKIAHAMKGIKLLNESFLTVIFSMISSSLAAPAVGHLIFQHDFLLYPSALLLELWLSLQNWCNPIII